MAQKKHFVIILSALVLTACSHSSPHFIDTGALGQGISLTTTPDDNQVIYVRAAESTARYCAETNIDYAATSSGGLSASFGLNGVQDSVGDQSSTSAVNFGGRDPAVLIARELMFRACEFNSNMNSNDRMALTVYAGTLDAIVKIAFSQQGVGTLPIQAAAAIDSTAALPTDSSNQSDQLPTSPTAATPATSAGTSSASGFNWNSAFDYSPTLDADHP